ncbi:MAG: hypothetical protein AAGC53_11775 [Actinomycetota bacterium]
MSRSDSPLVWYASYGSNCSRDRFLVYLRGGRAAGSQRDQPGARNAADPLDDGPVHFTNGICFSGHARSWGGAPAFLEHRPAVGVGALGRRYLITSDQFGDVLAQESGRDFDTIALPDLATIEGGTRTVIGDGFYDALVALDPIDGVPCVSFTSPEPPEHREPAPPSEAYLRTIVRGLADIHDLSPGDIADHTLAASGMQPTWDRERVMGLLV